MTLSRAILPALTVMLLTTASFAADAGRPPHGDHMGGPMSFLTPEERMMLMAQMRSETIGMTDDQRKAYRDEKRTKFMAMSDADKQKLADNLKAKWDGLSNSQKADLKQQAEAMRQRWQGGEHGDHGGQ